MSCGCQYLGKVLKPLHSDEPAKPAYSITNPPHGYRRGPTPSLEWPTPSMGMDDCFGHVFIWSLNRLVGWLVGPKDGTGIRFW